MWSISPSAIDENLYVIYEKQQGSVPVDLFLKGEGYSLLTDAGNPYSNGAWAISPAEEFDFIDVSYRLDNDDKLAQLPSLMEEVIVNNGGAAQQSMTVNYSNKVTETSSFSTTKGFSLTVGTSVKVGVPMVDMSINTSVTTSQSWTFGSSNSVEDTRSYSFPFVVPAYSSYKAIISVAVYNASATYIATYRGKTSGKIIKLEGKWSGVRAGRITYDIIDLKNNKTVKTLTGMQTKAVVIE